MKHEHEAALAAVLANRDTIYKAPWSVELDALTAEHNALCVVLDPRLSCGELEAIRTAAEALALRLHP